jgi:cytochrome c peroxidase
MKGPSTAWWRARWRTDFQAQGMVALTLIALLAWGSTEASGAERGVIDAPNGAGVLRTITLDGQPIDRHNPFFKSLGSNGRSCASCHVAETGWSISPDEVRRRFDKTKGLDPIFRPVDGATSPNAAVDSVAARRSAYRMLLNRGVIRVGLPLPANAEFEHASVDAPYAFASAAELSLFRRPLPATNLRFLTTVMWDGRESYEPMGTTTIRPDVSEGENQLALANDLMHQANDATMGHAQGSALGTADLEDIVQFETNLATAQHTCRKAGLLSVRGAEGGPDRLADEAFYVTINDVLGADVSGTPFDSHAMRLFDAWETAKNPHQAAIARGAALFGSAPIAITGVGGLNDALNTPVINGTCATCHDTPNVGNHSVALPIDIGISDGSRRTPDMPLYTLRNKATGEVRQTTDPGRALLTGRWSDIGKFKGPILRGLAARKPYFHDGSAAELRDVVEFYDTRFNIGFTKQEKDDLVAFLSAL